jgi:hypothetical protein
LIEFIAARTSTSAAEKPANMTKRLMAIVLNGSKDIG